MNALDALMWVARRMPDECALALERFVRVNPSWNGAHWEDCLDVMLDSDSHIELTEGLWEQFADEEDNEDDERLRLVGPIAVTLLYACGEPPTLADVRVVLEQHQHSLGTSLGTHDE